MRLKIKTKIKVPTVKVFRKVEAALDKPLEQAARSMAGTAREMVRVPYPGPSAAGMPPHLRKGKLRSGITSFRQRKNLYIIQATAKNKNFDYAPALEIHGTKTMQPRPFLRPMIMRTHRSINIFFRRAF